MPSPAPHPPGAARLAALVLLLCACGASGPGASFEAAAPAPAPLRGWEYHWDEGPAGARLATEPLGAPGWRPWEPGSPPADRAGREQAWFHVRLPGGAWQEPCVFLQDVEMGFEAYLDGQLLSRGGRLPPSTSRGPSGRPWYLLRLPPDFAGRELAFRVDSVNPYELGPVGRVTLGSRGELLEEVVASALPEVPLAPLYLSLGLVALALFLRRPAEPHALAFALYSASTGLVIVATSDVKQLLWNAPGAWEELLALGRILGPVSLCAFADLLFGRRHRWLGLLWRGLAAAGGLLALALLVDFDRAYRIGWRLLNLEYVSCYLAAGAAALGGLRRGDREARVFLAGLACLFGAGLHDALVATHALPRAAPWVPAGSLLFIAALAAIVLDRYAALHRALQAYAGQLEGKNARLERIERELQEAVRARDDFLSVASHELKTPITSLQLQVRLLSSQGPFSDKARERLAAVQRQSERLGKLAELLLDVSRLRSGKASLRLEDVDVAALAREVVARLAEDAARAGCAVEVTAPDALVGRWDRLRVDQILTNLLSNALKYGAGKPVRVEVEEQGGAAVLRVVDQGIGIAPEQQERIFERFERAVSSLNYAGLGLGLWISRELATNLGGRIRVESAPGAGARFQVELPREAAAPAPARAVG